MRRIALVTVCLFPLMLRAEHAPFKAFNQTAFESVLQAYIADADKAFANYKGHKMIGRGEKWEARSPLPGAYFCDVDWNEPEDKDPKSKAYLICDYGEGLAPQEAADALAAIKSAFTRATKPSGWRGIIKEGDDTFELFKPPDGLACGWAKVWLRSEQDETFRLFLSIDSTKTPPELKPAAPPAMQGWVKEDIQSYIAASRSNFDQFKKGKIFLR